MNPWNGWETGRAILVLTAILYLGVWVQLTLFHWAGAFKRRVMYAPVVLTPLFAVGALLGVVARDGAFGSIALALLAFGVVEGLGGVFFHLQGMSYQVGGLRSVRNFLAGPPPILPLAYALLGVLGITGLVWNA